MNIIFHTTAAIGIAVLLTERNEIDNSPNIKNVFEASIFAFTLGIISHGVLDYIPHCYPINSKFDVILGLIIIITTTFWANINYRPVIVLSFIGSIFPDLVDLLPNIINKQFGFHLLIVNKVFPWHWSNYSGSIYRNDCNVSTMNHVLLILTVGIICWNKRNVIKQIFRW